MTVNAIILSLTLGLGLGPALAMADRAVIEGMQEYLMFQDYESGIILPQQIDQTVFETALFVDVRDAGQFEHATIPGAVNIE